jgi:hypothetical protein
LAFEIAGKYAKIFEGLDSIQYRELRGVIIDSILATDMTCHFGLISELNESISRFDKAAQNAASTEAISGIRDGNRSQVITKVDRRIIIKTILHSADISNPCKSWEISKFWADALLEEFLNQGDLEKKEGIPVSPNMDRDTVNQADFSLSFIDFIVAPLYLGLTNLIPAAAKCCAYLDKNRSQWDGLLTAHYEMKEWENEAEKTEALKRVERRRLAFQNSFVIPPFTPENKSGRRSILLHPSQI